MGLMSPGGVHSHQDHVITLARDAVGAGLRRFFTPSLTAAIRRRALR